MNLTIQKTINEVNNCFSDIWGKKKIGFVPTMGALHEGHLQLVRRSLQENDCTIVSIFVNPIQFNDKSDFERYPRLLETDLEKLDGVGCHYVFAPSVSEMYPEEIKEKYNFGEMETVMEGQFRPGHFNGVATVVKRLFDIVKPSNSYFGEKDFQQLAIIKKLVKMKEMDVNIIPCPTVRESDGLAMSSRNMLLNEEERKVAPFIYNTLKDAKCKIHDLSPELLRDFVKSEFSRQAKFRLEYFEISDAETLQPITKWCNNKEVVFCIAAYLGKVRLIDNVHFRYY